MTDHAAIDGIIEPTGGDHAPKHRSLENRDKKVLFFYFHSEIPRNAFRCTEGDPRAAGSAADALVNRNNRLG